MRLYGFRPTRSGDFEARMETAACEVVADLMHQTRALLAPEREPTGDAFEDLVASLGLGDDSVEGARSQTDRTDSGQRDPALARLLPTAHKGDDEVATEFRRLTEEGLRQRKSGNLDAAAGVFAEAARGARARDSGSARVTVPAADVPRVLMALTDVRLLLGERLGLRTDDDGEELHEWLEENEPEWDPVTQQPVGDPEEIETFRAVATLMAWYDYLTILQESLTMALMGETEPFDPPEP